MITTTEVRRQRLLSLNTRVLVLATGMSATYLALMALVLVQVASALRARHREIPRVAVDAAWSITDAWARREAAGELGRAEAQAGALAAVRALRFADQNYVWVNDLHPRMVMHPFKPELDGKDLSGFTDPKGKRLFREMVDGVRGPQQRGFVEYLWPKPGAHEPVGKLSFVRLHPRWGWVLGAGTYTDDVESDVRRLTEWL